MAKSLNMLLTFYMVVFVIFTCISQIVITFLFYITLFISFLLFTHIIISLYIIFRLYLVIKYEKRLEIKLQRNL